VKPLTMSSLSRIGCPASFLSKTFDIFLGDDLDLMQPSPTLTDLVGRAIKSLDKQSEFQFYV